MDCVRIVVGLLLFVRGNWSYASGVCKGEEARRGNGGGRASGGDVGGGAMAGEVVEKEAAVVGHAPAMNEEAEVPNVGKEGVVVEELE